MVQIQEIETNFILYKGTYWNLLIPVEKTKEGWVSVDSKYGYEGVIEALHPYIINWFWEHDNDYEGYFYGLGYDKRGGWYYIEGSFGSCSGCDWYEGVSDREGAVEFLRHFDKTIIYKATRATMMRYLEQNLKNTYGKSTLEKLIDRVNEYDLPVFPAVYPDSDYDELS